jgi:hypothetical protein
MRALVGDAWQELSGYDGRFVRTFRRLLRHPGALTVDVLEGYRARYVSPVRVYLVASVLYFLIAAAAPNLHQPPAPVLPRSNVTIDFANPEAATSQLSEEDRKQILEAVERAPGWLRPALRAALLDPAGFRRRFLENLPRLLFALVPAFAGIVSLFYRRRPFSQHLIFALHLHAVVFLAQSVREAANWAGRVVLGAVEFAVVLFVIGYALAAFRRVYGERWRRILAKAAAIAVLYAFAGMMGMIAAIAWTTFT